MNILKSFNVFMVFLFILLSIPIYAKWSGENLVRLSPFIHHRDSRECASNRVHNDFSHQVSYMRYKDYRALRRMNSLKSYRAQDFRHDFIECGYTESEILNQHCLYMVDEFVKYAQTYPGYTNKIRSLYAELKNLTLFQKASCVMKGTYCKKLQKRIADLYRSLDAIKEELPIKGYYNVPDTPEKAFPSTVSKNFTEYETLESIYQLHTPSLAQAINARSVVYKSSLDDNSCLQKTNKSYNLNSNIKQLLSQYGYEINSFTQCYGNQLQQIIHQESLDILTHVDNLTSYSVLYDHQEALVDMASSIIDYNHADMSDKAISVADFCWTLLDYGQAIAEGAALGLYSAAHDILTNPIEATVSIVAGKQVLAFQLCKVLYNVADIGATAITNFDAAQEKWNKYTEPLNTIIDAINKKEITVRDAIKGGTAFVVGYKAQGKLLGGLGKFCNTIKHKSINFIKNNQLLNPQEYLTTPEGLLFKVTEQSGKLERFNVSHLKKSIEGKVTKHKSIKGLIKKEGLPTKGKLRYVPPKKFHIADRLPEKRLPDGRTGFIDRFGNVWVQGVSRTKGQPHEWDVQLSKQGIQQVGWMTRDNSHLNVSLDGRVTHK